MARDHARGTHDIRRRRRVEHEQGRTNLYRFRKRTISIHQREVSHAYLGSSIKCLYSVREVDL